MYEIVKKKKSPGLAGKTGSGVQSRPFPKGHAEGTCDLILLSPVPSEGQPPVPWPARGCLRGGLRSLGVRRGAGSSGCSNLEVRPACWADTPLHAQGSSAQEEGPWRGGGGGAAGSTRPSPLAGGHAVFQSLHEGEDPVVPQDHALGQAEVEGLHPHQPGDVRLGVGQHLVQQVQELFPGFVCRETAKRVGCSLSQGGRTA